jgi:DNA-binding CsgD family transcriptional regulator
MLTGLLGDAFEALQNAKSSADLRVEMDKFSRQFGFDKFIYALTITVPTAKPQQYLINGYPDEWIERYRTHGYFRIDPLVQHAQNSSLPSIWDANEFHEGKAQQFFEEAQAFGLQAGLSFSIHEQPGIVGIFSLSRDRSLGVQGQDLAALVGRAQLFATLLQHAVCRLELPRLLPEVERALTSRERECLKWSADGKTAWEIGQILNIAERTVVFHINNVVQKLDASNKTQAIVRAVVLRLI